MSLNPKCWPDPEAMVANLTAAGKWDGWGQSSDWRVSGMDGGSPVILISCF